MTTFHNITRERSADAYAQQQNLGIPTKMEILHAKGHGQIGSSSDLDPNNLAAGSHGANTQMIPYDHAITGHTQVRVGSHHNFYPGTQVAESTMQLFYHPNYKNGLAPFFSQRIDGDRSPVTTEEYLGHKQRAGRLSGYLHQLDKAPQTMSFEEMEFDEARRLRVKKRKFSEMG